MNIFRLLLFPFSLLFGTLVYLRNFLYSIGILKVTKVRLPVISVGNITVGGSGKTPYILKLIDVLKAEGRRPAVIYRGYKRTGKQPIDKVVLDSKTAEYYGDEATMVAFKTEVPVYVGAKRARVAKKIIEKENVDVILLDDGFQHRSIYRDLDIVVLDATDKASSYYLMPVGRAREPLSSLKRANLIALHKTNLQPKPEISVKPDIQSSIVFNGLVRLEDWKTRKILYVDLPPSEVTIVCGVAKPEQVVKTLSRQYPNITYRLKAFNDHYIFTERDLPDGVLIVTEKDAIKLKDLKINEARVFVMVAGLDWNLKYETLASKLFTSDK